MKKAIKLYDFSAFHATVTILAYLCLLAIFAGTAAGAENPLPQMIAIVVLVISFVALFWHFVGNALTLDQSGVHKGKKSLPRQDLQCSVFYHVRYREMTIRFSQADTVLTVQATKRNVALTEAWLDCKLEIPETAKRSGK